MLGEQEDFDDLALRLLCEVGAIEECEHHEGYYFDGQSELEEAYKLANARITAGQIVLSEDMSRRDFTYIIKEQYEFYVGAERCSYCDKIFDSDD
jgi:hypothetical protein